MVRGDGKIRSTLNWSPDDDEKLAKAVDLYKTEKKVDWKKVSDNLGLKRTPLQCSNRWYGVVKFSVDGINRGPWSSDEDEMLTQAVQLFGDARKKWTLASAHLGNQRSPTQCRIRWYLLKRDKEDVNVGSWSQEELRLLEDGIVKFKGSRKNGGIAWKQVSEMLGGKRSPTQCAAKWSQFKKIHGASFEAKWSEEEDDALTTAVGLYRGHGIRGGIAWEKVREHVQEQLAVSDSAPSMKSPRSVMDCYRRWHVLRFQSSHIGPWNTRLDALLRKAARMYQTNRSVDFDRVSEALKGEKSPSQCRNRWSVIGRERDIGGRSRGAWRAEEDELLTEALQLYFTDNSGERIDWRSVERHMNGIRSLAQCKARWMNDLKYRKSLSPSSFPHSEWTDVDDETLAALVHLYSKRAGPPWKTISTKMYPLKRTPMECYLRWSNVLQYMSKYAVEGVRVGTGGGSRLSADALQAYERSRNKGNLGVAPSAISGDEYRNVGRWSLEEDDVLADAVSRLAVEKSSGDGKPNKKKAMTTLTIPWSMVSIMSFGGRRSEQQCRRRWRVLEGKVVKRTIPPKKKNIGPNRGHRQLFILGEHHNQL